MALSVIYDSAMGLVLRPGASPDAGESTATLTGTDESQARLRFAAWARTHRVTAGTVRIATHDEEVDFDEWQRVLSQLDLSYPLDDDQHLGGLLLRAIAAELGVPARRLRRRMALMLRGEVDLYVKPSS